MIRPRPNLWPWRDWMTIGIGAICSESKTMPDRLILASDTLGSFGDVYSTTMHHKMFASRELRIFATGADNIEQCGDLMHKIVRDVGSLQRRSYGAIHDALGHAVWDHRSARFKYDVLPEFDVPPSMQWRTDAKEAGVLESLEKRWKKFRTNTDLIVGTFDEMDCACLFHVTGNGRVESFTLPGFLAVGTGADNALFRLSYRRQNNGMGVRRSAYDIYEAKMMAEQSPHVGKGDIQIIVASAQKDFLLNPDRPNFEGREISLPELSQMWQKYGPSDTSELDVRP